MSALALLILIPLAGGPHWLVLAMVFTAEFLSGVGVMLLDTSAVVGEPEAFEQGVHAAPVIGKARVSAQTEQDGCQACAIDRTGSCAGHGRDLRQG